MRLVCLAMACAFLLGACAAGDNSAGDSTANKADGGDPDRPSDYPEGVPGYLTSPGLVAIERTATSVRFIGAPGAVASDLGEPDAVVVQGWVHLGPLPSLPDQALSIEATLKVFVNAAADGSFDITVPVAPGELVFLVLSQESPGQGQLVVTKDEAKVKAITVKGEAEPVDAFAPDSGVDQDPIGGGDTTPTAASVMASAILRVSFSNQFQVDYAADTSSALNSGEMVTVTDGQVGQAASFPGPGADESFLYVDHVPELLVDEGCLALWINADNLDAVQSLVSKDRSGRGDGGHMRLWLYQDGHLEFRLQGNTGDIGADLITPAGVITANQWYHLVSCFGPSGMAIYVDGASVATDLYARGLGPSSGGAGNAEPLLLGAGNSTSPPNNHFTGLIDEFAIFDRLLGAAEISALAE